MTTNNLPDTDDRQNTFLPALPPAGRDSGATQRRLREGRGRRRPIRALEAGRAHPPHTPERLRALRSPPVCDVARSTDRPASPFREDGGVRSATE